MKIAEPKPIIHIMFDSIEKLVRNKKFGEVQKYFEKLVSLEETYINSYHKKKQEGVFYTRNEISKFMVKQALKIYLNNYSSQIQNLSICDPACGSGVFIISAAKELFNKTKKKYPNFSSSNLKSQILRNLYGYDINLSAVKFCILKLLYWSTTESNQYLIENLKILKSNIIQMDSLLELKGINYDIIIGNPPYGNIMNIQQKKVLKEANIFYNDIYCAFLLKSIDWTKGIICLLIPKSFLLRQGYVKFRKNLLSKVNLLKIFDLGPNLFKKATNEVQVLIFEKKNDVQCLEVFSYPNNHKITYKNKNIDKLRICMNLKCNQNSHSQKLYVYTYEQLCPYCKSPTLPLNRIRIKVNEKSLKLINKLETIGDINYLNIQNFPKMIRGEEDKGLTQIKPLIKKNLMNNCIFINAKDDFSYFYLSKNKSFNIERISPEILKGNNYEYYIKPKLLIKHNSIFPQAIFTNEKICFTSSIYSLLYENIQELKFLSALLNSILMQYYCFYAINNQRNTTINLNQYMIRHLPFKDTDNRTEICRNVDLITEKLIKNNGVYDESIYEIFRKIDKLVFESYNLEIEEKKEILTQMSLYNKFYQNIYSNK